MAACVTESWAGTPFEDDDLLAWNLGRSRADAAEAQLASAPAAASTGSASSTSCSTYLTDDYTR